MRIETSRLVVRDFNRVDAENLYRIVREKDILRFMPDWAEIGESPQEYFRYIDWHQSHVDSTDIYENKMTGPHPGIASGGLSFCLLYYKIQIGWLYSFRTGFSSFFESRVWRIWEG